MENTLLIGDHLLVNKFAVRFTMPVLLLAFCPIGRFSATTPCVQVPGIIGRAI